MHKYLDGQDISEEELRGAIRKACIAGTVTPVLCGSAFKNKGVQQLLDSVIAYERADWETCLPLARQAGLSRDSLPKAYLEALRWGQELRAPVAA